MQQVQALVKHPVSPEKASQILRSTLSGHRVLLKSTLYSVTKVSARALLLDNLVIRLWR